MKRSRFKLKQSALMAASVALIFADSACWANPTGAQVVNGIVSLQRPNTSTLSVTNSPGSIINWQGFSIGASEVTRFIQQSAASAVLNRVVGGNISQIQGQLLSNGKVFLINPSGIVVGPGAVIDTAGFVGSTLNMLDADFLAGKLKFQGDGNSGSIVNQGWIRTSYGGQVILVAPQIENSGLIHTPGGELILAAGQQLSITSLDLEGVQFELQAPTDSVVNVGKLLADGGAVGVFAGTLKHSGDIRANALVYDEGGRILLKARNELQLVAGSTTSADGKTGGSVIAQSSAGATYVAGSVSAQGSAGGGGNVALLGNSVAVVENAVVNVSGTTSGGQILIGGDYQGANAAVQNATNTFVGSSAMLRADATQNGDGGRIIAWSDDKTQFYGSLSAQGGPQGGNGGFAEVSGKQNLIFAGSANLGAPQGALGTLLLDPPDAYVFTGGGLDETILDPNFVPVLFPSNAATVSPATLAGIVGNVALYASRYMRISDAITLTTPDQGFTATVGTYAAPALPDPLALNAPGTNPNQLGPVTISNLMEIGANITTANGAVSLSAPRIQSFNAPTISTAGGAISLAATGNISGSSLTLNAGAGAVSAAAGTVDPGGFLQLNAVSGGSFLATAPGFINTGVITTTGAVSLSSSGSSINTSNITSGGGSVTANAATSVGTGTITTGGGAVSLTGTTSSVFASGITAGAGAVALSGTSVSTGTIDTTSTVALTGTSGSVNATVDNASSVTAGATNNFSSASVNLSSNTVLNATSVAATTTQCNSSGSCSGASISLNGNLGVNIGTVTATAPVSFNNTVNLGAAYADPRFENLSESVNVFSNMGPIRALSGGSSISASDVTLRTGLLTGGGIGQLTAPLAVNVKRSLTFRPNGEFNVQLTGAGPNRLDMEIGVAPATLSYSGTLAKTGQVDLNVSATDATVTANTFNISSGFDQRIFNGSPSLSLRVPNGNLVAPSVSVPKGDVTGASSPGARFNCDVFGGASCPPAVNFEPLNVTLRANNSLTVNSYTREVGTQAKSSTFLADNGTITLGAINANKDTVSVTASGGGVSPADITVSNLSTSGNVSVTTFFGDITVGLIDTASGTGSVTLGAPLSQGAVKAQTDSAALEVTSGGSVSVSGLTIGTSGFTNPLDLAGSSILLTSQVNGGTIGFAGAPILANTQNLTINAATPSAFNVLNGAEFNVSTGATALKNLTVVANPLGVGNGGLAQVRTEAGGANDRTYSFVSNGTDFTFNPGTVPATQFAAGTLSFTANDGNITLGNANLGTGALSISALDGSITAAGSTIDGASVTLAAGTGVGSATPVSITTSNIGSIVRPNSLTITAGRDLSGSSNDRSGSVTTGTIEAGSVGITAYNGNIVVGNVGTATAAGAVSLFANANSLGGAGTIQAGNVGANSISFSTNNAITGGNLNAASSITLSSLTSVTTGTLDAPSIVIGQTPCFCFSPPATTVMGAIGGTLPPTTVSIDGSTVDIQGAVTGGAAAAIGIRAFTGALTIDGGGTDVAAVTAGDGSTIDLRSTGATPFQFSSIDAGATGTVSINSQNGIHHMSGGGINAKTVSLSATNTGAPILKTSGDGMLDLNNTTALTLDAGGTVSIDANGATLGSLSISKRQIPDTAPFTLSNLGGSQSVTLSDFPSDMSVAVASPASPLNFSLNYRQGNIVLAGSGISTSGGNVSLIATGLFDGTTGGIATGGGAVTISADGGISSTGAVDSTGPTSTGGAILMNVSGSINVNGPITSGPGAINLVAGSAITRSGALSTVTSGTSVTARAGDGDIGSSASPLLVTAPTANLTGAQFVATAGAGHVFATLTGTDNLTLVGDNGFNVSSDTAFSTLNVTTRGSGTGTPGNSTLNLTASNQSYTFARPTTDLFSTAITNTFQVVSAGGTTPPTNATFTASNGDLLVGGPGTIAAASLTLNAQSSTSDLKLQGTTSNPLNLSHTTQNFRAGRDLLIWGNVALSAGTSQTLFASRNLTAQAEGGTIAFSAANQNISTGSNSLSLLGGGLANETVTISATGSQNISTSNFGAGSVLLQGGTGAGSSVTISHSGTGSQSVTAGGNITLQAGGDNAIAAITNTAGSQYVAANTDMNVRGGVGTDAVARISNTSTADQTIGESRSFTSFQTNNIEVKGGAGSGAFAEIVATAGPQQIYSQFGTLTVEGGGGTNATAKIESTSTNEQQIGFPDYVCCGSAIGSVIIKGGTGAGSFAHIDANGLQRVTANSTIALTGTTTDAHAMLSGTSQNIQRGNITLTAGAGNNANALIASDTLQFIDPSNVTLIGGGGAGATATAKITATGLQQIFGSTMSLTSGPGANSVAQITTTGDQTINFGSLALNAVNGGNGSFAKIDAVTVGTTQSLSGGNLTMTAGGAGQSVEPFVAVPNASALIEGHSQTISSGATTLNGGAGASGSTSDAIVRNLSGNQSVSASSITLNGGHTQSTTGILNLGTGAQTVSGSSGITLRSDPNLPPAHADSFVLIQNPAATLQTITANNGGVTLTNSGAGAMAVTSAGTQAVTSRFVDVTTSAASTGNATLSAAGNQRIHATNENATRGLRVAALGTGTASIESGASQLLEITYPEVMQATGLTGAMMIGDPAAAGTSRVKAVDQSVFAGSIVVQSGGLGSISELKAGTLTSGTQTISTLLGGISVLGGSGDNSLAQIDPLTQTILSNGTLNVQGGTGVNAIAQIVSGSSQTIYTTNGNLTLSGGTATGAAAFITNAGPTSLIGTTGNVVLTAGTALGADALITVGGGSGALTLVCGGSCIFLPNLPTANAGTLASGGITTGPSLPTIFISPGLGSGSGESDLSLTNGMAQALLTLQEDLADTLRDAEPDTAEAEERAPICT